jgi:hypothetical protein
MEVWYVPSECVFSPNLEITENKQVSQTSFFPDEKLKLFLLFSLQTSSSLHFKKLLKKDGESFNAVYFCEIRVNQNERLEKTKVLFFFLSCKNKRIWNSILIMPRFSISNFQFHLPSGKMFISRSR